jgi:hypothetical protein
MKTNLSDRKKLKNQKYEHQRHHHRKKHDCNNTMNTNENEIPLVVTTEHRGVFFGYGTPTTEKTIRITKARMCVHWPSDVKGIVGLAAKGPTKTSRISPACPAITLQAVTSIMECSDQAKNNWESEPWS